MTAGIRRWPTDLDAEIPHPGAESAPRSTSPSTVSRTAAATAARQRTAARRAAVKLGVEQIGSLDDTLLIALGVAIVGELERRGLRLEDPARFLP